MQKEVDQRAAIIVDLGIGNMGAARLSSPRSDSIVFSTRARQPAYIDSPRDEEQGGLQPVIIISNTVRDIIHGASCPPENIWSCLYGPGSAKSANLGDRLRGLQHHISRSQHVMPLRR